jgi:hypothetical protein
MFQFVQLLLGWFCADLLSGLVHLFFDSAQSLAHRPVIGAVHRYFVGHHDRPNDVLNETLREMLLRPLLPALLWVPLALWLPWMSATLVLGLLLTVQTHAWAHGRPCWPIRMLQACRLIIHPREHQRHHDNFRRTYGVVNGWSNPLINRVLWLAGR